MKRRTLLRLALVSIGGLAVLAALPLDLLQRIPFPRSWLDRRVTDALRALVGPPDGSLSTGPPAGWTRERALRSLLRGQSSLGLLRTFSEPEALLSHLEQRQTQDFRSGRVEVLEGWLLSETEIAVASLLTP